MRKERKGKLLKKKNESIQLWKDVLKGNEDEVKRNKNRQEVTSSRGFGYQITRHARNF